ncbi:hypothetical protein A3Q33_03775 [Colwellia sp. PAMC 21821]|nr:hypothetical protein A3Q33_03775 [Colwellia sp. PAMC 21821]
MVSAEPTIDQQQAIKLIMVGALVLNRCRSVFMPSSLGSKLKLLPNKGDGLKSNGHLTHI